MLNTGIRSLKELLTESSKTIVDINTQVDSLNSKGKGGDKIFSFANFTNSDLQHPTQRKN